MPALEVFPSPAKEFSIYKKSAEELPCRNFLSTSHIFLLKSYISLYQQTSWPYDILLAHSHCIIGERSISILFLI